MTATSSLVLLVALSIMASVTCYPNGAPAKDCWTERPLHGANMPAWDPSPYEIKLSKIDAKYDENTYTPGEYIKVTLRSRDGKTPFKGYLMKVYSSNGVSAGLWGARKGVNHVLKKCGVTHNTNDSVIETDLMWRAPRTPIMDTIQFKAIVVKDYETFYNILSRPLKKDYPPEYLEQLFKRLRAYAKMAFNVSVPKVAAPSAPLPIALDQLGEASAAVLTSDLSTKAPAAVPASDSSGPVSPATAFTSDQASPAAAAVVPDPARVASSDPAAVQSPNEPGSDKPAVV